MIDLAVLFMCYGIMFGIANKVPWLHGKHPWLDRLLACSYCLGFHSGWIAYFIYPEYMDFEPHYHLMAALSWAFTSAAFSYTADTLLQLAESHIKRR